MSNTSHPEILPETPAPAMVYDCQKCELSKQRGRVIWGEGDPTFSVKDLRGIVLKIQNQSVVVSYHPLAVRRRPVLSKFFLDDWKIVRSILDIKFI